MTNDTQARILPPLIEIKKMLAGLIGTLVCPPRTRRQRPSPRELTADS
jgi:hypothetical protein